MIYRLTIPSVAPDVEEIRILEWHGLPGAAFAPGDLLVELETHKALVEVRAGQAGILRKLFADAGEWTQIGVPLALFSDTEVEPLPDAADQASDLLVDFTVD